jgi:hypothetical protein
MLFRGRALELPLAGGVPAAPFYHLAEVEGWARVSVRAQWRKLGEGHLELDERRSEVMGAQEWTPTKGSQFLQDLRKGAPSLLKVEPEDILDDRQGDK